MHCSSKHYQHVWHAEQTGRNVHNVHPCMADCIHIIHDCSPAADHRTALVPFHLHGGQTQSRRLAETRAHWGRLGWNEYEGTSPWCCHGTTHRVLALLSPALLYILMHFFSSRWRWYRCSEMCYSRNLVHGEKNISRSHPHQFISGKFPFPVTSPRSRTPPKNRLQKRFVWIIMCLVWRNNGDWCLHLSSYFSCLGPRALQRCTSNQAIREGRRGDRPSYQMFVLNIFTSPSKSRKCSSCDYM